jgi:hypothetical protein
MLGARSRAAQPPVPGTRSQGARQAIRDRSLVRVPETLAPRARSRPSPPQRGRSERRRHGRDARLPRSRQMPAPSSNHGRAVCACVTRARLHAVREPDVPADGQTANLLATATLAIIGALARCCVRFRRAPLIVRSLKGKGRARPVAERELPAPASATSHGEGYVSPSPPHTGSGEASSGHRRGFREPRRS